MTYAKCFGNFVTSMAAVTATRRSIFRAGQERSWQKMVYNQQVNFPASFPLLRCCIAAMLLLSLWMSGAQDFWVQDALETGDIVLSLDADSNSDDPQRQDILFSHAQLVLSVPLDTSYPQELAQSVRHSYFSPPYRPPSASV